MFFISPDPQIVSFDDYPIHTITGLVKQWLRELPDPLMTYSLYNDFLYAAGRVFSTFNCFGVEAKHISHTS